MALLFMDGFEMGDTTLKWDNVNDATSSSASPRVAVNGGTYLHPSSYADLTKLITSSTTCTAGIAFRLTTYDTTDTIISMSRTGTYAPTFIGVNTGGYLEIRNYPSIFSSPQTVATGTTKLLLNTWYYVEMRLTMNSSNGVAQVRLNGAATNEVTYTGNTNVLGGAADIDTVTFKIHGDLDDCYILNALGTSNTTFLGDVRVYAMTPNGNGSSSQLTGSDGDSTNNYQLVGEKPYNTTNYVGSATSGLRDTYSLSDIPTNVTSVLGVQSNLIAAKSDAGAISMKPVIKAGSTLYYGATRSPITTYSLYTDIYDKNPDTTSTWTVSDVNSLEGGMEVL